MVLTHLVQRRGLRVIPFFGGIAWWDGWTNRLTSARHESPTFCCAKPKYCPVKSKAASRHHSSTHRLLVSAAAFEPLLPAPFVAQETLHRGREKSAELSALGIRLRDELLFQQEGEE